MSGLEVVGVVLGAIPILLKAVEGCGHASQSSRLFSKKRIFVKKLANALYEHNQCLVGTIKLLLTRSGYGDVTCVEGDLMAFTQNEDVREQIQECLGPENYAVFIDAIEESARTIALMAKDLHDLIPPKGTPTGDLYEIIKASNVSQGMDVVPRLKFVFQASNMKRVTEELDATTVRLERFVRFLTPEGPLVPGSTSPKAKRMANGLIRVREFAQNLYTAISHGWGDGTCHPEHNAKLILDDHLDSGIVSPKQARPAGLNKILEFRLEFCSNTSTGCEATVAVMKQEYEGACDPENDLRHLSSAFSRVTISTPVCTAKRTPITTVRNLCVAITAANSSVNPVSFVLTSGPQLGTIATTEKALLPYHHRNTIALDELIQCKDHKGHPISLKTRMMLALKLASNVLQLSRTPWLREGWSCRKVSFPICAGPPEDICARVDFTRPLLSSIFKKDRTHIAQGDINPEVTFLELGIVLLEIWHQKSIEAQFPNEDLPSDYYKRMTLASRWRKESFDPPVELYDRAIRYCIFGVISSPTPTPKWDDKHLWSSFCGEVIEPLYQSCKSWR